MYTIYKLIFALSMFLNFANLSLQAYEDGDRTIIGIESSSEFYKNSRFARFSMYLDDHSRFYTKDDHFAGVAIDDGWKVGDTVNITKNKSYYTEDYIVTNLSTQTLSIIAWIRPVFYHNGID